MAAATTFGAIPRLVPAPEHFVARNGKKSFGGKRIFNEKFANISVQ
jgi:hypothetical protein